MYEIWKVPVDAYDDPPQCGIRLGYENRFDLACEQADLIMASEGDPASAYFVIDSTGKEGTYSVGYIEPVGARN
jgi:hypothetical protein|tara:strand:+ start:221 stop:442 length:222 start_codon:yes stop_codon:yes gene_type:complete